MDLSRNPFKAALRADRAQIGLWVGLASADVAEALAPAGFDWLLLDGEHAPNDLRSLLAQLRAVAPYAAHPIVRVVEARTALIKQVLDIGAQTVLVPMVDTPAQAAEMARAMRYPPAGVRGIGAALARASRWNQVGDYVQRANDEVCLLVQAESVQAIEHLAAIAGTEGVDGVFFGPADLAGSMGLTGQAAHPRVVDTIIEGIATVRAAGKAAGVLMTDPDLAQRCLDAGARFVAVGVDALLLVGAARALAARFGGGR